MVTYPPPHNQSCASNHTYVFTHVNNYSSSHNRLPPTPTPGRGTQCQSTHHDKLFKEHLGDGVCHGDCSVHHLSHQTGQGDHSLDITEGREGGEGEGERRGGEEEVGGGGGEGGGREGRGGGGRERGVERGGGKVREG